jgi:hypothetical protein
MVYYKTYHCVFFCFLAVVSNPYKAVKATLSPRKHRETQQSPSLLMRSVHNGTSPCPPRLLFPDVPTLVPVVFPGASHHAPLLFPAVPTKGLAVFPSAPAHAPGQTVSEQLHVVNAPTGAKALSLSNIRSATTKSDKQESQSKCAMSTVES